jgi:quinol monooxygenase YgiN
MKGIVVKFKAKPGKAAEFERLFKDLQVKVKANEPGVLVYELAKASEEPDTYVAVEFYADQAAFDHHVAQPYFTAVIGQMLELWEDPQATRVENI